MTTFSSDHGNTKLFNVNASLRKAIRSSFRLQDGRILSRIWVIFLIWSCSQKQNGGMDEFGQWHLWMAWRDSPIESSFCFVLMRSIIYLCSMYILCIRCMSKKNELSKGDILNHFSSTIVESEDITIYISKRGGHVCIRCEWYRKSSWFWRFGTAAASVNLHYTSIYTFSALLTTDTVKCRIRSLRSLPRSSVTLTFK